MDADGVVLFGSTNATKVGLYRDAGKIAWAAGSFVDSTDTDLPTGWCVLTGTMGGYAGSRRKLFLNGVPVTIADPGSYNIIKLALGAYYEGDNAAVCDIEELWLWGRSLNVSEFAQLHAYLAARTGITFG
jgi:hypothetical protein